MELLSYVRGFFKGRRSVGSPELMQKTMVDLAMIIAAGIEDGEPQLHGQELQAQVIYGHVRVELKISPTSMN